MDMLAWAEREIELACKREKAGCEDSDEWNYGVACYESALRAFESLLGDEHSGMSIGITKTILNRLIDRKPLSPIEGTDDEWEETIINVAVSNDRMFQNKRRSSLFKTVHADGSVTYKDIDRCYGVDLDSIHIPYHNGLISRVINEKFPITFPYVAPDKPYKVVCETFLTNPENGDYDTKGVLYAFTPDGDKVGINRFFKEGKNDWIEIDKTEYMRRKMVAIVKGD